ncbi:MAG: LPS export ABC transporter permease LptF [Alphaproteobacteria bacterium]
MRQYERYLFLHLLWPTVLVTLSLTGIIWLTEVLRFIDFMLNRGLSIGDFLYLTGLMLPSLLLIIIPIALAIAVIYTYNKLTGESELIVLNAVGVSKLGLSKPMVLMAVACMLVCYALSAYLMPIANGKFRDIHSFFRDKYASMLLEENVFNNPIDGVTVFIRSRDANDILHGILLHDSRNKAQEITLLAQNGRLIQGPSGPRFVLQDGQRQQVKDGKVSWLAFHDYTLDLSFYARDVQRPREPDERSIPELFTAAGATPHEQAAMRAEGHQRLTWPLFTLALPLLSLAILFSGEFNRRGQWKRVIEASVTMILIVMLFFMLRNMVVKHPWLVPSLYILVGLTLGAGLYMLATGRALQVRRLIRGWA